MVAFLTMILSFSSVGVNAVTDDIYTFTISNGEVTITDVYKYATGDIIIPKILGGSVVTRIDDYAFEDCSSITSVIIPDTVTNIGACAFYNCTSLTTVNIPDSVTSVGGYAFRYCSNLTSISVGNSIKGIGVQAFSGCISLTEVYISNIEAWCNIRYSDSLSCPLQNGANLYLNGELVTDLEISQDLLSINNHAFYNCSSIRTVTIGKNVMSIGDSAFNGCTNLTSVIMQDGVLSIGNQAFQNCSSLTTVQVPDSVTSVGSYAFRNCESLTDVYINDITSWCSIDYEDGTSNPLYYADNLFLNNNRVIDLVIPDDVILIPRYAFSGVDLTHVTIPDSVMSIGDYAFYNCSSLDSVIIGTNVTSIGVSAFNGCKKITNIIIPDSVTKIENAAFAGCSNLTDITIPYGVTNIGNQAFWSCESLTSICIPDSVISIGIEAFYNCSSITCIETGDGIVSLSGFELGSASKTCGYPELQTLVIGDRVTSIDKNAFWGCEDLTDLTIGDRVINIGDYAFRDCINLKSVSIPGSVSNISNSAFHYCLNLFDIHVNENNTEYTSKNGVLFDNDIKTLLIYPAGKKDSFYIVPNSVTSIGKYAFYNCPNLINIFIPDSVISIGYAAIWSCESLTSITIPDSVTSIDSFAFSLCPNLASIYVGRNVTSIGNYAFSTHSNLTVYGYEGSITQEYTKHNSINFGYIVDGSYDDCLLVINELSIIPNSAMVVAKRKDASILDDKMKTDLEGETYLLYDIHLLDSIGSVQPNGDVEVRIKAYDANLEGDVSSYRIYHIDDEGKLIDMKASYIDGYFVFNTDHFSLFIAKQTQDILGDINGDKYVDIDDALLLFQNSLYPEYYPINYRGNLDFTKDGYVDIDDALLLFQYSLYPDYYPIN